MIREERFVERFNQMRTAMEAKGLRSEYDHVLKAMEVQAIEDLGSAIGDGLEEMRKATYCHADHVEKVATALNGIARLIDLKID